MSCGNVQNIKIQPCDVYYSIEEQYCIETVADVAGSLDATYFNLTNPAGDKFHVWMDGGGADPAPANSTAIPVVVAANASAATVAAAVAAAVDLNSNFHASALGSDVTITADLVGQAVDWADFDTGFLFTQTQDGGDLKMGYLDGDIEVTFEETVLDITAHQGGVTPLTSLRQGLVNTVGMTMKELDLAKYKELMLATSGAALTPSGGTEVFGWGSASLGGNTIVKARRLVLHPVVLDVSDKSKDLTFWKSYAQPDSMTISGENPQTLGVNFKVYKDDSKPTGINQFIYGDWSQFVPVYP